MGYGGAGGWGNEVVLGNKIMSGNITSSMLENVGSTIH